MAAVLDPYGICGHTCHMLAVVAMGATAGGRGASVTHCICMHLPAGKMVTARTSSVRYNGSVRRCVQGFRGRDAVHIDQTES